MSNKYSTKELPILAEGDCLGVFYCGESEKGDGLPHDNHLTCRLKSLFDELCLEAQDRNEKIFVSPKLYKLVGGDYHLSEYRYTDVDTLLMDVESFKAESSKDNYSGGRLLLHQDDFKEPPLFEAGYHHLLKNLQEGGFSIAVTLDSSRTLPVELLACFPRIFIKEKICRNHFFLSHNSLDKEQSIPYQLLLHIFASELGKSTENLPFPMGVPDMLEFIIESMGVGVVVGDTYGNMVLLNRVAREIMGLPPSSLPYPERVRRFGNFLPDGETPYPFQDLPLSRAIRGEQFDRELIYVENENRPRGAWVQSYGRGVKSSSGELVGGVCVFMEVTQQIEMEEQKRELERDLQQSQKIESLGLLAGGVAHDFNNLLVGVLGNVSLLLQDDSLQTKQRERLTQIEEASGQLADLTGQLLMYAGKNPEAKREPFDLGEVCNDMASLLASAIPKTIRFFVDIDPDILTIVGDKTQVKQVLLNLVMNAADAHGGEKGKIQVRTGCCSVEHKDLKKTYFYGSCETGRYAFIEVSDTGCGMSEELQQRIFDPFFSSKGTGRGLGLSSVLGIVKAHKGCVTVYSNEGEGTTFSIYFPIAEGVALPEVEIAQEDPLVSLEGRKILIVDDEEIVLDVAKSILSMQGMKVDTESSGKRAMQLIDEACSEYDLILLDMTLPDANGLDIYTKVRKRDAHIPVIISSGYSEEACSQEFQKDPMSSFLAKPYPAKDLLALVRKLLCPEEI